MTRRTPASYKKRSPTHGAKVIAHLEQLRADDCLGMHYFEGDEVYDLYPKKTRHFLKENDKAPLPELVRSDQAALFSLSLLPHGNKSMKPFIVDGPAYLFDLSVEHKNSPALVVRAFPGNGGTGDNRFNKQLQLGTDFGVTDLDGLYRGHTEASFKAAVAADPSLSTAQLKALAATYDHPDTPLTSDHNEIVAAVRPHHIAAIALPFDAEETPTPERELTGALMGLAHLEHHIDVPVVLYNVNSADPAQNGKCVYVAQGYEQCRAKAIEAIRTLQKEGNIRPIAHLKTDCKSLLGIDVEKPIDAQLATGRV